MATYILFWNPGISSYTMERFLDDFKDHYCVGNWSFYEHDEVKYGDVFYMVRCGEGKTGIVMRGEIVSHCYEDKDWSPKNRKPIYYADIEDSITINPETASVMLTPELLTEKLPDFNWFGGHSGRKLSDDYAAKLDEIWFEYVNNNPRLFSNDQAHVCEYKNLELTNTMKRIFNREIPQCCEVCGYDYKKVFGEAIANDNDLQISVDAIVDDSLPQLFYRVCSSCDWAPKDVIANAIKTKLKESNG